MDKQIQKAVSEVINWLFQTNIYSAAKYISPTLVVRAVRKRYNGKLMKGNSEISLVIGKPNYEQREFIKKVKEPFPVKKVQIKLVK